ncbi:hypothetical protein R1sor_001544 [Riccia sorocarpa]|uniref:Uncharacterized protein n=1 Tax=Riccia sorocarpa TaxID=122646 RepID=A0ABD3GW90_9MARC
MILWDHAKELNYSDEQTRSRQHRRSSKKTRKRRRRTPDMPQENARTTFTFNTQDVQWLRERSHPQLTDINHEDRVSTHAPTLQDASTNTERDKDVVQDWVHFGTVEELLAEVCLHGGFTPGMPDSLDSIEKRFWKRVIAALTYKQGDRQ